MKRRDFVVASASLAGAMIPGVGRAGMPCPPPLVGVSGGTSATTNCTIVSGSSYLTGFDTSENPLSEGGKWASPPQPSGTKWTPIVTDASISGGIALGTNGAKNTFDDSYAKFVGFDFPSATNIEVKGIVYRHPSLSDSETHELELWFCIQDGVAGSNAFLKGYEVMFSSYGTNNMGKWLGGQGMNDIPVFPNYGPGYKIRDGDEIKATLVGNVLTAYVNGSFFYANTDNNLGGVPAYNFGRPGFGAFKRPAGLNNMLGFKSISIRAI